METERLTLRPLVASDLPELEKLHADPEVMRYLDPDSAQDVLDEGCFLAGIEKATGRFIGWFEFLETREGEVELGYRLHREFWGSGYATEGSKALIRRGFTTGGVQRIFATTMFVNSGSRRVMEKCGLRHVRTFHVDWDDPLPGSEHGEVEYALTREEWQSADMWQTDLVDLDAYFARTGASASSSLTELHEAHVRTIPFENIDVMLGLVPSLDLADIQAKMIGRRRGGYCYEHQLLFTAVLERLGYTVARRMSRAMTGPRTHFISLVDDHLVDVGFGAGMLHPMPLVDGAVVDQAGWPHRLRREANRWVLEKQAADDWVLQHQFEPDVEQRPIDYLAANFYVSKHERSPFSRQLVVMRLEPGLSRRLVGTTLTIERAGNKPENSQVENLSETLESLDVALTERELSHIGSPAGTIVGARS
ncbi:GNAT family N-acetyltransferase [Lentzea sp. NPDC051838]|uniref:GNAT family N-acetyltransferase n=1 Tax=Lentzea sp. NPDC051838 TaxID=3154849 RepID=UPI00341A8B3A